MRKKVAYYGCSCGEGRLEEIAKTNDSRGNSLSFYDCVLCHEAYYQKHSSWNRGNKRVQAYDGVLTKDDIKQYVPQENGNDLSRIEMKVLRKKNPESQPTTTKPKPKAKKTWFYKCDCQPGVLTVIAKTKAHDGEFMKFYGCHECDNVYWQKFYCSNWDRQNGATKLMPYKGTLTAEDIRQYMPTETGANLERMEKSVAKKKPSNATSP